MATEKLSYAFESEKEISEKVYKVAEGIRFDEELASDDVDFILSKLKEQHENIASQSGDGEHHSEDSFSFLVHRLAGSTTEATLEPLKPNCLISGYKTPEEFSEYEQKSGGNLNLNVLLNLQDMNEQELHGNKGRMNFFMSIESYHLFRQFISEHSVEKYPDMVNAEMSMPEYYPSGKLKRMPVITALRLQAGPPVILPKSLSRQLALEEYKENISSLFRYVHNESEKKRVERLVSEIDAVIDTDGWRFEKK